jgi:iduronate 2-sulfatase
MLFETCDRVPLVIRVPGQTKAGSVSEGLVELVDLFPTLTELCGVTPPAELQGRSLVPMLRDPSASGKDVAYTVVMRGAKMGKAIRTNQWHYTLWPDGSEELYDFVADPHEDANLVDASKHLKTLEKMRNLLRQADSNAIARKR